MALGKVFASRNRSCAYLYIFSRQMEAFVFSILKILNTFGTHGTKFLRTANRLLREISLFFQSSQSLHWILLVKPFNCCLSALHPSFHVLSLFISRCCFYFVHDFFSFFEFFPCFVMNPLHFFLWFSETTLMLFCTTRRSSSILPQISSNRVDLCIGSCSSSRSIVVSLPLHPGFHVLSLFISRCCLHFVHDFF